MEDDIPRASKVPDVARRQPSSKDENSGLPAIAWVSIGCGGVGVVMMILGVCAAIAIPAVIESRKAAMEAGAKATILTISAAESTFRQVDGNRNGHQDYWTADVRGLYAMEDSSGSPRKFIPDKNIAAADYVPANCGDRMSEKPVEDPVPYNGYFVAAFARDENGDSLRVDVDGDGNRCENEEKFAFMAFPVEYDSTGTKGFIVNQRDMIYTMDAVDAGLNEKDSLKPAGDAGKTPPVFSFPSNPGEEGWRTK